MACTTLLVLLMLAAEGGKAPPLPDVVARIDGKEVSLADYSRWLLEVHGASLLNDYLDQRVLLTAAAARGALASEEEVESAFQAEWNTIVKLRFSGDEKAFLAELASNGNTRETLALSRKHGIRYELTLEKLCQVRRTIGEPELRDLFARRFGNPPMQVRFRLIFVNRAAVDPKASADPAQRDAHAAAKAQELAQRAAKGADFAELARTESQHVDTAANGGMVDRYVPGTFGATVDAALAKLSPENPLSEVVRAPGGYFLLKLEDRKPIAFEEAKGDLEMELRTAPASGEERLAAIAAAREDVKLEKLAGS